MDRERAKGIILREFNDGGPYPFQPTLKNTLDEKARRKLEKGNVDLKFDQERLKDIPYMYRHEVRVCYVHGEFFATIVFSGAIVEHVLSSKLKEKDIEIPRNFADVIETCRKKKIITNDLSCDATRIRCLRNLVVHPYGKEWDEIKEIKKHPDIPQLEEIACECVKKMENILEHLHPLSF